jgi:hypothetical protein
MKPVHVITGITILFSSCGISVNKKTEPAPPQALSRPVKVEPSFANKPIYSSPVLISRLSQARKYARENDFSTSYCFFVDMSIHSGRKRFFVYDLEKNAVVTSGLVAHGSCRESFLTEARFSNMPGCGCTSVGKYRVGERYRGQYGKSFKLYGLDPSNSNAFRRAVVLHGFSCVPDEEVYPKAVCNSLGCAMVSPNFFNALSFIIEQSRKPIILWVYK